jgi:hypothetical protein
MTVLDQQHPQPTPVALGCLPTDGQIAPNAVVHLSWRNREAADLASPAQVVREFHHFPRRGGSGYAYFDRRSSTALLGQGSDGGGPQMIGILLRGLPSQIELQLDVDGTPGANATLGVRVDFRAGERWIKALFVHDGLVASVAALPTPWGTRAPPGQLIRAPIGAGTRVALEELAPPGWQGDAILTFVLDGAAPGTRVRAHVR